MKLRKYDAIKQEAAEMKIFYAALYPRLFHLLARANLLGVMFTCTRVNSLPDPYDYKLRFIFNDDDPIEFDMTRAYEDRYNLDDVGWRLSVCEIRQKESKRRENLRHQVMAKMTPEEQEVVTVELKP